MPRPRKRSSHIDDHSDEILDDSPAPSRDKREAFKRLAIYRTNLVLDALRKLGNLSNRANYIYDDRDVQRILDAVERGLEDLESRFGGRPRGRFRL